MRSGGGAQPPPSYPTHMRLAVPLEQAQEYLARVLPWPQDGDPPAFVNIQWTFKPKDLEPGRKWPWTGRAVRSVGEAVNAIEWASSLPDAGDIYVCLSTQRDAEERRSQKGRVYYTPKRSQPNAVALKSLFLDLDAKGTDKNSYGSLDEAVTALGKFLRDAALPKPSVVVASGGGLHVYWTLARALTPHEWTPLAYALAEATKRHGLKCDTQCTIDSARVLRVPNTVNRKFTPPKPVRLAGKAADFDYSVERMQQALLPYAVPVPASQQLLVDPSLFPPRAPLQGVSDLEAGVEITKAPPVSIKGLVAECGFIREALRTGGAAYTNPLWNLTTLLATFTDDGRTNAHLMGRKHPGYTRDSTDELYDRKERERDEKNLGWPSCATISASGSTACQVCPHFGKGKSPLNHAARPALPAQVTPQAAPQAPAHPWADLPKGYIRDSDGVVLKQLTQEDGTHVEVPICQYPMEEPWLQRRSQVEWVLHFKTVTDAGRRAPVSLKFDNIATDEGLKRSLWSNGITPNDHEVKAIKGFFVAWIQKLQQSKDNVVSAQPFGWFLNSGRIEGFCFDGAVWTPNGSRPASPADPVLGRIYTPSGDIQHWRDAAALMFAQNRPSLNAIIASAFAAPLVRFTGQSGLLMCAYSIESGLGKSSAMKVAQSVWGDPVTGVKGLDDTHNSAVGAIAEMKSLPLYWDELKTEEDTRNFVNLVFQLSSGRGKSRMTQSATLRDTGKWQTMLISASNESLIDFVTHRTKMTVAGLMRVFEFEVPPPTGMSEMPPPNAENVIARLHDSFGWAGLEYAKFLGADFERVGREVEAYHTALKAEVDWKPEERFWVGNVTAVCMGAHYANQLGLTAIDEAGLKDFLLTCLGKMREERGKQSVDMKSVMNVVNVLGQYLNAMRTRHTIFTNRIHIARGKPASGSVQIMGDISKLDGIYCHVGLQDKLLRISSMNLSEWLGLKKYSRHLFTKALEREMGMKIVHGRMASGTHLAGTTEYLLEINLAGTPLANFIDEA